VTDILKVKPEPKAPKEKPKARSRGKNSNAHKNVFNRPIFGIWIASPHRTFSFGGGAIARKSPYDKMIEIGNLLIAAQRLEAAIGKRYSNSPSPELLADWKLARSDVEALVRDYLSAIAEWRAPIQSQIRVEHAKARKGSKARKE
jgi:hypothetical protein